MAREPNTVEPAPAPPTYVRHDGTAKGDALNAAIASMSSILAALRDQFGWPVAQHAAEKAIEVTRPPIGH